jgi:hypothetical protein
MPVAKALASRTAIRHRIPEYCPRRRLHAFKNDLLSNIVRITDYDCPGHYIP